MSTTTINIKEMVSIEMDSFPENISWCKKDFKYYFKEKDCVNFISLDPQAKYITGYIFGRVFTNRMEIINLAVKREERRKGYGSALVDTISSYLNKKVMVRVPERMLEAQLFFRSQGFKAIGIEKTDGGDLYIMVRKRTRNVTYHPC